MPAHLNTDRIYEVVNAGSLAGGMHLFDSIDSTNTWALGQCDEGRDLPFVCFAEHQTKGRGRRGRHWISPECANIYMSLAWPFQLPVNNLGILSLMQGVAVVQCLHQLGVETAEIKWPNDVLVNGSKIAGILIETTAIRKNSCKAVIGIGLNYRMPDNFEPESSMRWTDLVHVYPGTLPDRGEVAACLLKAVMVMCQRYQQYGDELVSDYADELDALAGRQVQVLHEDGRQLLGTTLGVTARGELRVLINGSEQVFSSADISLISDDRDVAKC